jgi:precorrin-6B methylase 2
MINSTYAETLFNFLYSNVNGYKVSTDARAKFGGETSNLLYGELPFETFAKIVERINPKPDGIFYDLGSGTGRIVLQAHILFNFKKSIGIELLDGLHDKALEIKEIFDKNIKLQIADHINIRELHLIKGDLFQQNYSDADFIFMNHPIKDSELFLQLEEKLACELKPGTKIVTTIRALKNPRFKPLGSEILKFSWGDSTAHFFEA